MPRAQVAAPGGRLVVLKRFLDSQVPACRREIRILHRFSRACGVLPIEGFFVQANTSDVYVQLPYLEHGTLANYYDEISGKPRLEQLSLLLALGATLRPGQKSRLLLPTYLALKLVKL